MTDEEKRFERREEARLDDMYDAQCETKGDDMTGAFNKWWNDDGLIEDNPFSRDTPAFWAWEGWVAGVRAEREACAQICDEQMEWGEINKSMAVAAGNCADLIRERGQ
jgi:hypothetical protein